MSKKTVSILLLLLIVIPLFGQGVVTTQPKIMVLPAIKQGENYRTILEEDINRRIAITKVKEAFDNAGFTTVDLVAKLKALSQSAAFQEDNQTDLKKMIVEQSGADIYVEVETAFNWSPSGNSVKMILTAYEVSTGNSLSNKVGDSGKFYTKDVAALSMKAVSKVENDFMNTMQYKFDEIVAYGRSIVVNFGFLETSDLDMDAEVGSGRNPLKDELEQWMEDNAYKNQYHIQGTVSKAMIFDDVKIPLMDPVTGRNYSINKFLRTLRSFLHSIGLEFEENINGSTIYINFK